MFLMFVLTLINLIQKRINYKIIQETHISILLILFSGI